MSEFHKLGFKELLRYSLREIGAGSAEYAGIIFATVALVGALLVAAPIWGEQITCTIGSAISRIGGGEGYSCDALSADDSDADDAQAEEERDYKPDSCLVHSETNGGSAWVKLGIFKFGSSFALAVQSENVYNQETGEIETHYNVVAVDTANLGVEGGIGTKGEINNSGLGADLSAEAGFKVSAGDTWNFDSEEELNSFMDAYSAYRAQRDALMHDQTGGYALSLALTDGFVDPPRQSDSSKMGVSIEGDVTGTLGLKVGTGDDAVDLGAGLYLKAKASGSYSHTVDNREGHEGEYSDTFSYSGSISGGDKAVFAGVEGSGSYEGALSMGYNKDRELTSLTFTQTTASSLTWKGTNGPVGSGVKANGTTADKTSNTTTTTLEVTDENRAIVEEWMANSLIVDPQTGATFLMVPANVMNPSEPVPGDAMQQLLYEEATNTHSEYENSSDGFSIGGEVALGLKVGAGFSTTDNESNVLNSTYLGAPDDATGIRPHLDNVLCE